MSRRPPPDERVARVQVLHALAVLEPLAEVWEPVGSLAEDARMALAGEGGLDAAQLLRLRVAAHRWLRLDPRLRHLYVAHAAQGAVQAALWAVLLARRPTTPSGKVYGSLRALWVDVYGYEPALELVPVWQVRLPA